MNKKINETIGAWESHYFSIITRVIAGVSAVAMLSLIYGKYFFLDNVLNLGYLFATFFGLWIILWSIMPIVFIVFGGLASLIESRAKMFERIKNKKDKRSKEIKKGITIELILLFIIYLISIIWVFITFV